MPAYLRRLVDTGWICAPRHIFYAGNGTECIRSEDGVLQHDYCKIGGEQ